MKNKKFNNLLFRINMLLICILFVCLDIRFSSALEKEDKKGKQKSSVSEISLLSNNYEDREKITRILCIDCQSLKETIPTLEILHSLEEKLGEKFDKEIRLTDYFDHIVASSSAAIIGLGLSVRKNEYEEDSLPAHKIEDVKEFLVKLMAGIDDYKLKLSLQESLCISLSKIIYPIDKFSGYTNKGFKKYFWYIYCFFFEKFFERKNNNSLKEQDCNILDKFGIIFDSFKYNGLKLNSLKIHINKTHFNHKNTITFMELAELLKDFSSKEEMLFPFLPNEDISIKKKEFYRIFKIYKLTRKIKKLLAINSNCGVSEIINQVKRGILNNDPDKSRIGDTLNCFFKNQTLRNAIFSLVIPGFNETQRAPELFDSREAGKVFDASLDLKMKNIAYSMTSELQIFDENFSFCKPASFRSGYTLPTYGGSSPSVFNNGGYNIDKIIRNLLMGSIKTIKISPSQRTLIVGVSTKISPLTRNADTVDATRHVEILEGKFGNIHIEKLELPEYMDSRKWEEFASREVLESCEKEIKKIIKMLSPGFHFTPSNRDEYRAIALIEAAERLNFQKEAEEKIHKLQASINNLQTSNAQLRDNINNMKWWIKIGGATCFTFAILMKLIGVVWKKAQCSVSCDVRPLA